VIEISDYDLGTPTTHVIELYRSDRIDCYNGKIDGKLGRSGLDRVVFWRALEEPGSELDSEISRFAGGPQRADY
tara:strand:+ start:2012 stop:2233 length:222 start_codon:yes stop_codon:yes gene_type:complete